MASNTIPKEGKLVNDACFLFFVALPGGTVPLVHFLSLWNACRKLEDNGKVYVHHVQINI